LTGELPTYDRAETSQNALGHDNLQMKAKEEIDPSNWCLAGACRESDLLEDVLDFFSYVDKSLLLE